MFGYQLRKLSPLVTKFVTNAVYFSTKPSVVVNIVYNIGNAAQTTEYKITSADSTGQDLVNLPFWIAAGMTKLLGECMPEGAEIQKTITNIPDSLE